MNVVKDVEDHSIKKHWLNMNLYVLKYFRRREKNSMYRNKE